ncbi:plasmid maintenance protein (plasmid) [Borrelia miyamotoi]|uniref:Plasmid maintenance protein n=1 Tax=Borrelia miyamotoi TaxID=47466 RepID=A0AAX3JPZ7_9SPIR|nr:plasmid maintenance protein [Borrelia miyamotoi]ATQ19059.1 plasmid maintenance protein [Borrelia miyamotoi]ATQ20242.1 plasmid maintenance protein [Borrelia miyamotoi]QBK63910.1 hypothetical protein EZU68_05905 [Borrelia miyamotoi]QBL99351.1 hypothetical protein EZU71_05770 [Borrelia miyamotoi]WAZ72700.1 plasmid maintenance protein [Borrelia miyamotoi]
MENNKQANKKLDTQCLNKYQHKLISLISTIAYVNNKYKKYTQSNLLYYFNGNLRRNGHKETTLKTLQKYLYKLEKILGVTINYYRHLGVNMGTEIHYELKYTKKKCHYIINKYFKDKKEEKHQNRVNAHLKKRCNKKENVEKAECLYNINNKNKEEYKNKTKFIEKLQIKKYAKKSKIKYNLLSSILDLNLNKEIAIEIFKAIKRDENQAKPKVNDIKRGLKVKQKNLQEILKKVKNQLTNEGYSEEQLKKKIKKIYEQYENKPHFIIEKDKYSDLKKIIEKIKKTVEYTKKNTKESEKNIKDNIFSILIDQLRHKVAVEVLVPVLKDYLSKQDKLEYGKLFNNQYYHDILDLIRSEKELLNDCKSKQIFK